MGRQSPNGSVLGTLMFPPIAAMPGYRSLSPNVTGSAADSAREAEVLRKDGDPQTAVHLLEEALDASRRVSPELPGWLCGRLAALYRTLGRYDDEVALLERYRESQTSEEARSRYDARLSKARTIAERKRRTESGALQSVRTVLGKPRRRTPSQGTVQPSLGAAAAPRALDDADVATLRELLGYPAGSDLDARLDAAVAEYCAAGRARGIYLEQLVDGLRHASTGADRTHVSEAERDTRFSAALVHLLASFFEEVDR